jgi:6-phosphogluconolactonase
LTITPPVIAAARDVLVLAAGAGKADAVARALEGAWEPAAVPAQWARRGTWVLDGAAAGQLRRVDD